VAPPPKWYVIAKNEYRIITSSIRGVRRYLPFLIIAFLIFYIFYLTPNIVDLFVDEFTAFILTHVAVAIIEIILFMFAFYFTIFPISRTLKDIKIEENEILLSTPIKPSDILLGKFLGQMPFYAIGITLVTGFFTALIYPLGLDVIQIAIIIISFTLIFLSALWIGVVIAAILRTRLGSATRGRDIGKALGFLVALPMIAIMYALMGGGLFDALADSNASGLATALLSIFPSSWGAELTVVFAANPSDLASVWFSTVTRFGGLIAFFVAVLWLGYRAANRAYNLETVTFTASKARMEGNFYKVLRRVGKPSFGSVLVSMFKDYGRRFENISRVVYIVGIMLLIVIFFGGDSEDPIWILVMGIFILPIFVSFVAFEATARGKENLFVYRKSPFGESGLVKARFLQTWLVVIPVILFYSIFALLFMSQVNPISWLLYIGVLILIGSGCVAFVLGLFLAYPEFSEKPEVMVAKGMIANVVIIFLFFPTVVLLGETWGLIILTSTIWILGAIFLYLGKTNISKVE